MKTQYEVTVGNIGTVYRGDCLETAREEFLTYEWQSKNDYGRAAGEHVCLWVDNEPVREHHGNCTIY
jgi:hypothetical protein